MLAIKPWIEIPRGSDRLRRKVFAVKDGDRQIVLQRGKKPVPNGIVRKDKREPLDMRCGLSHSSARRGICFSFRRPV
jgi:hypothetical protein